MARHSINRGRFQILCTAGLVFVAMLTVLPSGVFAGHESDDRPGRNDRGDRYRGRDRDRDWTDIRVDVRVGDGFCEEPRVTRVWVEPVYRTVCERVWVEPVYRTVCDRVWIEPVYRDECERVWVPDRWEYRRVPYWDGRCHIYRKERVLVERGHWETRTRRVLVCPGRWETIERQELVCAGHWKTIERQELVTPGHWETRVVDASPHRARWDDRRFANVFARFTR